MKKITRYFTKISGYKMVSKCKNCGSRLETKTETHYCDACLQKLRDWRFKNEK